MDREDFVHWKSICLQTFFLWKLLCTERKITKFGKEKYIHIFYERKARLVVSGEDAQFINTHFSYFSPFTSEVRQS